MTEMTQNEIDIFETSKTILRTITIIKPKIYHINWAGHDANVLISPILGFYYYWARRVTKKTPFQTLQNKEQI